MIKNLVFGSPSPFAGHQLRLRQDGLGGFLLHVGRIALPVLHPLN